MAQDTLRVGNVEIIAVSDYVGNLPLTLDQLFPGTTLDQWQPYRDRYPDAFPTPDTWNPHFGTMVLRTQGRTILVDTGAGPEPIPLLGGSEGRLVANLRECGIDPDAVDVVFMTHAHIDHVGWNLDPGGKPTFERARYVLHRADWDAAKELEAATSAAGAAPYVDRQLSPLESLGILDLVDGDTNLADGVSAFASPGHTPGHMCVLIASGGEKALIPGDSVMHPAIVTEPDWRFAFDHDPEEAIRTRNAVLDRVEAEGLTLATCHFPPPGFGKIFRLEGKRYWAAL